MFALVHVSTAYCHCDREIVQEVIYPGKHDPHKILDTVAWMPDHILEEITPKIVSGQPNTYAFSKNLSEKLVAEYASKIPMGIARPSIVTGTWKEPMPGWVDNLNGPTGIMIGAGKGVIRSMHCKPNYNGDFMPVDITVNTIIAMAWKIANTRWSEAAFSWRESGKPLRKKPPPVHQTEIRTSISPSSAVWFNTILTPPRRKFVQFRHWVRIGADQLMKQPVHEMGNIFAQFVEWSRGQASLRFD
ncbi:unnamed protein product [Timema podura]|uniref:Fatty acyl-CoA reductase n=1 Tax=Timema podura TaxID=61482 RepID=A0ABN7NVY1_TIMPD|nr:unnamed protein product [Timema podura]